jgi:NADH-quinone oxidoreductase subunit G
MPVILIDGKPHTVHEGQNLLQACLSLGFDVPYFCWHPALHSVGACRLCAVKQFKDEHDTEGRIVMSCMTPATDGARISLEDPAVLRFRKAVIEWLMLNHPHDCPVCDEGGECHLQDMTVMAGHTLRRTRFKKRTFRNQDLGPFVRHEMNRCIECYRCVHFYNDYAGGRDLCVLGWHGRVYFGRHEDGVLQNKFSGNLVEVCPTGVFTDKTFARHFTRKWDLQTAPSICVHCGLGCNTLPGERYGVLRRIRNRYHRDVNGYFLCDLGRFGYEFVNDARRIRRFQVRQPGGALEVAGRDAALEALASLLGRGDPLIGIGSARASLESNFALRRLVGPDRFYAGLSTAEAHTTSLVADALDRGPVPQASLYEVAMADAALVLGEDVCNTAPLVELALRASIRRKAAGVLKDLHIEPWNDLAVLEVLPEERGPLFIATPGRTDLDDTATQVLRAAPDDIARLGLAVAHKLDGRSPRVDRLEPEIDSLAQAIANALGQARRPVVVSGVGLRSPAILAAAMNVANALHARNKETRVVLALPQCNSLGLALMGARPVESAIEIVQRSPRAVLIVLETDLYRHLSARQADRLLDSAHGVVVIDCLTHRTAARAHVLVPAATFAESSGTVVSLEARAQRFLRVFDPADDVRDAWRWIAALHPDGATQGSGELDLDTVMRDLVCELPAFAPILAAAPPADFRKVGQKIPRQTHRASGRTAEHADKDVREPEVTQDPDTALAFSMEGYPGQPPAPLITHFWAPGWNSIQSVDKFQEEVAGPLRGGDGGVRLLVPDVTRHPAFSKDVPKPFTRRRGDVLVVPTYHLFGSDELGVLSPGIAQQAPQPYIALHPVDADEVRIEAGEVLKVPLSGTFYDLPVRLTTGVAQGVALVPMGLSDLQWDGQPFWAMLQHG